MGFAPAKKVQVRQSQKSRPPITNTSDAPTRTTEDIDAESNCIEHGAISWWPTKEQTMVEEEKER